MLRISLAILLTASVAGLPAAAASPDQRLLADAADGRLDNVDFATACLIAGGTGEPTELVAMQSQWSELRGQIDVAGLRDLHTALHSQILAGHYRADASDLGSAIRAGDFNCLTAAALYWDLAAQAGISLQIWSRPGHVYLLEPASGLVIEPASRSWGSLPASPLPQHTSAARQITPLALVGKFYYNRGLKHLQQGQHAEGLACIRASLRLDPGDGEAQRNLLAGLNNWAVALCGQERFAEAGRLIEQGLAIDPGYPPLVANARYVRAHRSP